MEKKNYCNTLRYHPQHEHLVPLKHLSNCPISKNTLRQSKVNCPPYSNAIFMSHHTIYSSDLWKSQEVRYFPQRPGGPETDLWDNDDNTCLSLSTIFSGSGFLAISFDTDDYYKAKTPGITILVSIFFFFFYSVSVRRYSIQNLALFRRSSSVSIACLNLKCQNIHNPHKNSSRSSKYHRLPQKRTSIILIVDQPHLKKCSRKFFDSILC